VPRLRGRGRVLMDGMGEEPVDAHRRDVVLRELKSHAPFTALGALSGIALMLLIVLAETPREVSHHVFYVLHPAHVLLSAFVTAAMYRRYKGHLVLTVIIGYVGSVGIGTISDIILPHLGGWLVGAEMGHFHIGFIEKWWLVNPLALAGVAAGICLPRTKVPHYGHVLLSTWASLFYLATHGQVDNWLPRLPLIFIILFFAVWLPCCLSDIAFPLLFIGKKAPEEEHAE